MRCITTASLSILINGVEKGMIHSYRIEAGLPLVAISLYSLCKKLFKLTITSGNLEVDPGIEIRQKFGNHSLALRR